MLFGELLAKAALYHVKIDGQQLGDNAHVHHVSDQLTQLDFGTDGGRDLVEGHGISENVLAYLSQIEAPVQALLIDDNTAGRQALHIDLGSLGIHRDQNFRVALAGYVTVFAGPNQKPGWLSGNIRGEKILAADGNAHAKDTLKQNTIR